MLPGIADATAAAAAAKAADAATKDAETASVGKLSEPIISKLDDKSPTTTKAADAAATADAATKVESLRQRLLSWLRQSQQNRQRQGCIAPATDAVEVRKSDVHLIDPPVAEPMAAVATTGAAKPGEVGASTCLNVESDGMHWGFRNKCAYSVQFAYCTMDGRNQLTACKDGFVGGSVAANGFGVLVADQNLRALNENHDFRWVACQGGAGEVIARLDKSDPPVGRCVR